MRRARLFIMGAAMAVATALHAQPKPDNIEIDCVNDHVAPADVDSVWMVQRARRTPTEQESAAMDRLAEAARGCAAQNGWTQARTVTAIIYAIARVIYEEAVRDLAARGIAPGFLEQVAADLGERGRTALLTQDTAHGNLEYIGGIVARNLAAVHAPIRPGSPELVEVGRIVGRGVAAMIGRDQALRDFDAP
jgi:hypothetical protein